jgi:hypothetical protein
VRQARYGGENLLLERRITTALSSSRIRIEDVVSNQGSSSQRHMFVYHFNIGFPILSEHSRLDMRVLETLPHDEVSAAGLGDWHHFQPPTPGFQEQNFWHTPVRDADGWVRLALESPLAGLALRWSYDATWLPHLLEWKMMGQGAYVVGIEPCNCLGASGPGAPDDPAGLPQLARGESRRYALEMEVIRLGASV